MSKLAISFVAFILLTFVFVTGLGSALWPTDYGVKLFDMLKQNPKNERVSETEIVRAVEGFRKWTKAHKLDRRVVYNLTYGESKAGQVYAFNPDYDARGLMQIREIALQHYLIFHWSERWEFYDGKGNLKKGALYNPEAQYRVGCWLLQNLRKSFKGDMRLAIAAYNTGEATMRKSIFALGWADKMLDGGIGE